MEDQAKNIPAFSRMIFGGEVSGPFVNQVTTSYMALHYKLKTLPDSCPGLLLQVLRDACDYWRWRSANPLLRSQSEKLIGEMFMTIAHMVDIEVMNQRDGEVVGI